MIRFRQMFTLTAMFALCCFSILAMAQEQTEKSSGTVEETAPGQSPAAPEAPAETAPQKSPNEPEAAAPQQATTPETPPASKKAAPVQLEDISIISTRPQERPQGVDISSTPRRELDLRPNRNFVESLQAIPGITTQQANGPRDYNISIRGFGAKTSFAIRNVKMYEDGIAQTQSDGLSRLDLHDPWFMQGVEVLKGPSSSQYDNYALGGVLFFRTRRGSDIMGTELDTTLGSWGYQKYAAAYGWNTPTYDTALMASYQTENGYIRHSNYTTITENLNFRFHIDDRQDIYFKLINNDLDTKVPNRLTLNQFNRDPRSSGATPPTAPIPTSTPESLDQGRKDRRTIVGALYERQLDSRTVLTMEGDFDVKDVYQPFSTIFEGVSPNFKTYTDLRHDGFLFGAPLRSTVGFFFNYLEQVSHSYQNMNDFSGNKGVLLQTAPGSVNNIGGRFRFEWDFLPHLTAAAGFGIESSHLEAKVINYTGAGAVSSRVNPNQVYMNYAPEVSLTHRNSPDTKQWVRVSTGYGIPSISNLTTDLTGGPGINTGLKSQKNGGVELGAETQISPKISVQLVGFWTIFKDEIITQSTTIGSYSINADRSEYKGIEAGATVKPFTGARITTAYTYMDATYKRFTDQYLVAGVPTPIVRDGKQVPAVVKNLLYVQAAYDALFGLGGFVEARWVDSYFADNANTLKAPQYTVFNANLHYIHQFPEKSWFHFIKAFIEMDNLFNRTYVGSTAVVSNSPCGATPTTTCMNANGQAFFSGYARSVYGGVTVGF
jgi:iron complex outermembrane receptor protein